MAHLIDMSNGRANMAYVGETPWHGLGTELKAGADIDTWRKAAGLEYSIERAPVVYEVNGVARPFERRNVLYRNDTGAALGVVTDAYKILQPGDVLGFFRDLCADKGFTLETAGALKGGAVYWALAKTGHDMNVAPKGKKVDRIGGYVLLSTGADGTRATEARFTSVRVVCNNTLSVATRNIAGSVRTSHVSVFDADATKEALGLIDLDADWKRFREQMLQLQDAPVTDDQANDYFVSLLKYRSPAVQARNAMKEAAEAIENARKTRGLEDLVSCYHNAPGAQPGTAYGLVQAVTRYIDHVRGPSVEKRLNSAWFGQGSKFKDRAMSAALEIAA